MLSAYALGKYSGIILFDIGRLSRSAERSKRIFHRKGRKDKMQPFPQRRAFAESGAANTTSHYDPSRENGIAERPQALRYPEIKI